MAFQPVNIGEAATLSGVSTKMIRHYEEIGLIPKASRTYSGYRTYSENEIHTSRFIRQARDLGFPMREIGELLGLWRDRKRSSGKVKALALEHIRELDEKIHDLNAMKAVLAQLARHCHGDERPECPIIEELAGERIPDRAGGPDRAIKNRGAPASRKKNTQFR